MMGLLSIALPVLQAVGGLIDAKKVEVANKTGLSMEAVGRVSGVVNDLLTKDERVLETVMAEIDKARVHDSAMLTSNSLELVSLLRGLVRPVITLTAFFWYVYARCSGLALSGEDYAIVGGIMAFWFGLRPFEKVTEGVNVTVSQPKRGS